MSEGREVASWIVKEIAYPDGIKQERVGELIRCSDCIHHHANFCSIWSKFGTIKTRDTGFCYMAER